MLTLRVHDCITIHEEVIKKLYNTKDYDKFAIEFGNTLRKVFDNVRFYPINIEYKPNFEKDILNSFQEDE